jgi:hypothetical protein
MLGRFTAASDLVHGRALVRGQFFNFALAWTLRIITRPARAGQPTAAAGHRTGSGIIVDRLVQARADRQASGLICT